MGAVYPWQTKYLFADIFLFMSEEGDKATWPAFATANVPIKASSVSLEALSANSLPTSGPTK